MKPNVLDLCIKKNIQTINTNPEKSLKVPHNRQVNSNNIKVINCITVYAQFSWSLGEILILNMLVAAMTPLDCLKHTILIRKCISGNIDLPVILRLFWFQILPNVLENFVYMLH